MSINNILGQQLEFFDPELAAIQAQTEQEIAQIQHSKRDPVAVEALQELANRLVTVVQDVDAKYGLAQYLADLQLFVTGPGTFRLDLNERHKTAPMLPIGIGKQLRAIQIEEFPHGQQEPSHVVPSPSSGPAGSNAPSPDNAGAAGGNGPVAPSVEPLPFTE